MGVALFDLDRTLIDCNSGRLWMQYELRHGRLSYRDALWASYWLVRYHLGHTGGEKPYEAAVKTLEGLEEEVLVERTQEWFDDEVAHRLRPGAREVMAEHRASGDALVLATSSTQYVARCAAEAYELSDVISTDLEVSEGRFTGRIASLAFGPHKRTRVEEWAAAKGVDLASSAFYTDSFTDLEVLEVVGRPVVVNPDRRLLAEAQSRGWPVVDWGSAAHG